MTIPERKSTWPQKDSDVYGVGCQSNKYRKDTIQVAARMHLFAVIKILTRPVALLPTLGQNADMSRTFVMYPWRLQSSHIESTTGPAANKRCGGRRHLFPYAETHNHFCHSIKRFFAHCVKPFLLPWTAVTTSSCDAVQTEIPLQQWT